MILFSERQSLLLELLSELDHVITGRELADLLGVSARTLRYDISRTNGMAKAEVIEATPKGYRLNRPVYYDLVARNSDLGTELGHQERILLYLFNAPVTDVYDIMRDCYLSESVTRAALQHLVPKAAEYGLSLTTSGARVELSGDELDLRRLLGELVHNAMDVAVGRTEKMKRYLPDVELSVVEAELRAAVEETRADINDIQLSNTVVSLAICLQRFDHPPAAPHVPRASGTGADELTGRLLARLGRAYPERTFAPSDREYVRALLGLALDHGVTSPGGRPDAEDSGAAEAIRACLDETIGHFNLEVDYGKLSRNICDHVLRLVARPRKLPYFRNNLQESLRARSPFLYDVAVYLADRLSKALTINFSDDEIGLLVIYLGLHTEQPPTDERAISAVVVCPRYHALQDWLLAELVERFPDRLRIVDIVASNREADAIECDLVITTTDEAPGVHPSVRISAVLSELDCTAVDAAILREFSAKMRTRMAAIMSKFLDPGLFFVGPSFPDATSTIHFLSGALRDKGYVPEEFEDSVLLRETYSPTAFARRFALPHSMDFMAHETKVAVLIPSSPIPWETADVSLVFMLAINGADYDEFIQFYQPLISLLYDPRLFSELKRVTDFEAFAQLLGSQLVAPNRDQLG
ncbi:MAG: HTH domain-containing protein [Propionibacteriaceae bacterium]|uniref:Phosphoenolpyruvate-dependent sugar phosphotransferase system, EIIA 2 n=1 Tax=Propionibacterium ruminifibrarum TaxID=1962131 RepID=A0A375I3I3_9ACTN|nr:PTS sugar transporter subunit IIA [Propionibacterium ruminifibrarum]MBE6476772.1 HTH domain-containing protein [Propionibacteriaceae bacterium]SPF69460.1 Phosphoenolpyruvate-dependent sugar phosphotransferase system, EIIA 2 [Propionibacterium ruminifibrarum]